MQVIQEIVKQYDFSYCTVVKYFMALYSQAAVASSSHFTEPWPARWEKND